MNTSTSYTRIFYAALAGYTILIFLGNWHHINQQGIFFNQYLPIATNLLDGHGYALQLGKNLLYPIWGYTLLTMIAVISGYPIFFLAVVQFVLCIIAVHFFYKIFKIGKKYWHIPLFTPLIALMSVRWPDAIVGVLIIVVVFYFQNGLKEKSKNGMVISGLLFGILLNFRGEYLGLLLILFILLIISLLLGKRSFSIRFTIFIFCAGITLLPWAYYSYSVDKHIRLTGTNGGGVLYITLGQLPENPWGIAHSDSVAYAVARQEGINDPYSPKGDSLLTEKFIHNIESNPGAFVEKTGYNIFSSFIRGVYIGEYQRPIELLLKILFILIFDLIFALSCIYLLKHFRESTLFFIIAILIIYKFTLIGFIQYEPRHMNSIYLFLLGPSLFFWNESFTRRKQIT